MDQWTSSFSIYKVNFNLPQQKSDKEQQKSSPK
ncbi:hypothetical protein FHS14_002917 [Paenibacillus baekrokdamisoli]|nr:hypothetical protein [Paenibacillus baekrokdamisoli]